MNRYIDTVARLVQKDPDSLVMVYAVLVTTCQCAMCGRPTRSGARPKYGRRWVPVCAVCWTTYSKPNGHGPDPRDPLDRGVGGTRP